MISRFPLAPCGRLVAVAFLLAVPARSAAQKPRAEAPTLGSIVDSAAVVQALSRLSVPALPRGVQPLFVADFDSTGAPRKVERAFEQIPAAHADPVAAAVLAHLKPQPPSRFSASHYLRVTTGAEPSVRLVRELAETSPQIENRGHMSRELERAAARFLNARGHEATVLPEYRAVLRFRVHTDGTPDMSSVTVIRSTGEPRLDREAIAVVASTRFRPATLEGLPVTAWVQLPLIFQTRR